jgi:hypothetical protein
MARVSPALRLTPVSVQTVGPGTETVTELEALASTNCQCDEAPNTRTASTSADTINMQVRNGRNFVQRGDVLTAATGPPH